MINIWLYLEGDIKIQRILNNVDVMRIQCKERSFSLIGVLIEEFKVGDWFECRKFDRISKFEHNYFDIKSNVEHLLRYLIYPLLKIEHTF